MENNLFDEAKLNRFVKKYDSLLKIDDEKREALDKWRKMLNSNELTDETSNYGNFQDIVLRQILGYSIDDLTTNYTTEGNESVEFVLFNKYKEPYVAIELKGSNKDLTKYRNHKGETVMQQASRYATSEKSFKWCIASNYDRFIFFNKNSREEYISFDFADFADFIRFKQFLLIFGKSSLIDADIPSTLLEKSRAIDKDFEDEFYKLFSETRLMLIKELEYSSNLNKDDAIHYAQLILNRYIFICFAEDKALIPQYTNRDTITTPIKLGNLSHKKPRIWQRLNELFDDIDEGRTAKNINEFNGGIFKEDLSFLRIRDYVDNYEEFFEDCRIKWKFENKDLEQISKDMYNKKNVNPIYFNFLLIAHFNFNTELDVNILGHIFENSIGDIEDIKNGKENKDIISERNKLGVFYTPPEITEYFCYTTILPFLSKSKKVKDISDLINEYYDKDNYDFIDELDDKLKNIKILDPACGSGAFLNKATDILLEIHSRIHHIKSEQNAVYEKTKKINGRKSETVKYYQLDSFNDNLKRREIVLNNIYGVDINPESVELTKLAMFLKVAKKGLKLPTLDKNIKCGNSLIDDKTIDPLAFDWDIEFKEVFDSGGFDIIVGNPPYGIYIDENLSDYYSEHFPLTSYKINLFVLFVERMLQKFNNSIIHFIIPKSLLFNSFYKEIRKELLLNTTINEIYTIDEKVFDDAEVGGSLLIKFTLTKSSDNKILMKTSKLKPRSENNTIKENLIQQEYFLNVPEYEIAFHNDDENSIKEKLLKCETHINDFYNLKNGLNPGNIKNILISDTKETDLHKPIIWGKDITKYNIHWSNQYVMYDKNIGDRLTLDDTQSKKGMKKQNKIDYSLRTPDIFENEKLVIRKTGDSLICCFDDQNYYFDTLIHGIYPKNEKYDLKFLMSLLNSPITTYLYRLLHDIKGKVFPKISLKNLKEFPIPNINNIDQTILADKGNRILKLKSDELNEKNSFINWLKRNYVSTIPAKVKKYYTLDAEQFLIEIKKTNKKFKRENEDELIEEFNKSKSYLVDIKNEVLSLEKQINFVVYELYGFSEDEIEIIENNIV